MSDPVERIFQRSEPHVREIVRVLIERALALPGTAVDPKGTCIHLNHRVAFAGLHSRRSALLLNLRSLAPIESPRIRKAERVSANRYHNELLIESADAIDGELMGWIAEAHALAG
jgi:Domain of unknown function (DUF5655)